MSDDILHDSGDAELPKTKWVDLHGIDPDFGETEGMELDRLRKQVAAAQTALVKIRSYHGNSIDPSECMECADGVMPCRTATAADAALAVGDDSPPSIGTAEETEYSVAWEIDVSADSPESAARKARAHQVRPGTTATVFDVYQDNVHVGQFDLSAGNA